ncbi:tetratricopeptide repeat protein [Nocardioides sp.]|uniref:tetratricopeptide repeat protein n=1 Tax=Nocardioides sp. TaxID=35761 RepID=UPI0035654005
MPENRRPSRPAAGRSSGGSAGKSTGKPSGKPTGKPAGKPTGKPTGRGKPDTRSGGKPDTRSGGRPESRSGGKSDARSGGKPAGRSGGRPDTRGKPSSRRDEAPRRAPRDAESRTREQALYDGPELPENITGAELDRAISSQLKGLPEKLASRVARHLAAAGIMIDDDPETAYQHTLAARARAPRLAVVREAAGEAAYAAGHYAEALADLRAAKRMNGATAYIPIMADCHRALGHPDQAVKLAKSPSVAGFPADAKAEMTIVEAGARRDMGQLDAALRTLELAPLMSKSRESWVVRLRYAYADTLAAAGRDSDALTWFHRTVAIDADNLTDAPARAEELEQRLSP